MSDKETARVTTFVRVEPTEAFEIFTQQTDLWWRRGPRFRFGGARRGVLRFEPGVGGRLFEQFDEPAGDLFEVGKILVWEVGARLVFEWRLRNFAPGEATEVEVRFEASEGGTRILLEHRGFAALRKDHPARHGLEGGALSAMIGLWWGQLLTGLRDQAKPGDRHRLA